ncbi:MAG: hypothetical protein HY689_01900 [Chloroflexi bacterium]|nr:hypothetical protein [Chloroflexota bacterium]
MSRLYETLSPSQQLDLAVRTKSPARLAQTFVAYVGQFYDRTDFDVLARQVSDLYAADSNEQASRFRSALDRRLSDRYHAPVAWDIAPARRNRAA